MKKIDLPILIQDAATILGVLDSRMSKWIHEDKPSFLRNFQGTLSIPKSYLMECSRKLEYHSALLESIESESKHKSFVMDGKKRDQLHKARNLSLELYRKWIDRIEEIHKKYNPIFNRFDNETWEMASYLLISRAIGLLKGVVVLLSQGHWYAGSMIREVDETLDVAQYFKICAQRGDRSDLINWFRASVAPSHSKCREAIAVHYASIVPNADSKQHEYLLNDLYQKNSKWTHPNFGLIREASSFSVANNKYQIDELCYGECQHELKMFELVDFFKSSIWTTYQQFALLFADILDASDTEEIWDFDQLQSRL